MRRYIFKINLNIRKETDIETFLKGIDEYLCLGNLLPESPYGFCLGVVDFVIEDIPVALALYMVNDNIKRQWVREGGYDIEIENKNLREQLFHTAKKLIASAS